jgi:hypothetical protein
MATLRELALESYDKLIGLQLSDVAVDCCITKAPCGGVVQSGGAGVLHGSGLSPASQRMCLSADALHPHADYDNPIMLR